MSQSPCRDHPREYGENYTGANAKVQFRGSSPRIRGKWIAAVRLLLPCRIIPANTGKMGAPNKLIRCDRDHPREYGENAVGNAMPIVWAGSSPRIRGKYGPAARKLITLGIIPANTGKIAYGLFGSKLRRDHPREYGENVCRPPVRFRMWGSSPRIRGKCGTVPL